MMAMLIRAGLLSRNATMIAIRESNAFFVDNAAELNSIVDGSL
jgi:hypothetical protein